jgi:sister-chromatid-cohesion protein PDS5
MPPRRRVRSRPAETAAAEQEEEMQEPEPEVAQEVEDEPQEVEDESEREGDEDGHNEELQILQFDEELSWRPAKPIGSATLVARLERLSKELAEFDQGAVDLESIKGVAEKLAHRNLLQHKDKGVKAYTACCLVDILRLYVPDAPFTSDQLKVCLLLLRVWYSPPTHKHDR